MHKYLKWMFLPVGGALLFLLAMTWFTGYQVDRRLADWLVSAGKTPGIATSWFDQEKSLFTRKAELHLLIAEPAQLLTMSPSLNGDNQLRNWLQQQGTLELYIELQHSIFPGFIQGKARINMQRGSFAHLPEKLSIPHDIYWKINSYTGDIVAGLNMEQWNWLRDEQTWLVSPLNIQAKLSGTEQIDLAVVWQGMEWRDDRNSEQGKLLNLTLESKLTVNDGLWLMPQAKLDLEQLELRQPDRQLQLKQWHWLADIRENRDGLLSVVDVNSHSDIQSLSYSSPQNDYQLSELKTGFALGGVNREGVEALLMNSGLDADNIAKWKAGLNLITRSGVHFRLDPFNLQLNRQPVKIHGELTTRPFDISQVHEVASMRSLLQGDLSVEIAQTLAQQFTSVAGTLPDLLSDGYLEQDMAGHISTKIRMVNGKLSANGVAVPY